MPGLSQLKQFNADMLNVGDEVKIRSARGEKPVTIGIPKGIDFEDDSEDFRAGMPQLSEEEQQQAEALAAERDRQANDFSDITGESSEPAADIEYFDVSYAKWNSLDINEKRLLINEAYNDYIDVL